MSITARILVTGAGGQLGCSLRDAAAHFPNLELHFFDKYDFDITVESRIHKLLEQYHPHAVVNAAAYTNVEKAELEPDEARLVNTTAVGFLAQACHAANALLVHFSTDYVFDGRSAKPYTETDEPRPLSVYGRTKWEGEKLLDSITKRHITIRTSWLYSAYGHNFFKTMLRLAKQENPLRVVSDQVASPTYAGHLALDVCGLLERVVVRTEHTPLGIYHYAHDGETSWHGFATGILKQAGIAKEVEAIKTGDFFARAERPAYSKLDNSKWKELGLPVCTWQQSLADCLAHYRKLEHTE